MGQFIKLPGVTPGTDRPRVDLVDSMAPNSGGLLLIDATHPVRPAFATTSIIPADQTVLPNALSAQAIPLVGGNDESVSPVISLGGGINKTPSATTGALERTAKGGLHVVMPTTQIDTNLGVSFPYPPSILNYLAANPTHAVFMSLWGYLTRPANTTQGWAAADFESSGAGLQSAFLFSFGNDGTIYPAGGQRIASRRSPAGSWRPAQVPAIAPAPFIMNTGLNGYTGTPGTGRRGRAFGITAGSVPPFGGATTNNVSGVFYRAYLEDLTVSGRKYADVDALDYALFTKEVLTAGGRFYGDTYTAPSSLVA